MRIGVPTEIKADEYRVGLTPPGVRELTERGHDVIIQRGAGEGSAIDDRDFERQGASLTPDADAVFSSADAIIKVKEPQPHEVHILRPGQILFTYLHLAPDPDLTRALIGSGATCIAYETVVNAQGGLPLLAPMSEIAGKVAAQASAFMLEKPLGGRGLLLGGAAGVPRAKALVIGGGTVGFNAARVLIGLGAETIILDRSMERLRELDVSLSGGCSTAFSSPLAIETLLPEADLVIGAVLIPGARAPRVLRREHLTLMKANAVVVDVSIDQGGCFESSQPTTHSDPTYEVDGILHYCVANMPGAVPITSTWALTNATLPYVLALADLDLESAVADDPGLAGGVSIVGGRVTNLQVAQAAGESYTPVSDAIAMDLAPTPSGAA
jgi:alanine dehydrogenase